MTASFFKDTIYIDGVAIGPNQPVYLVAEMSANHGQDFNRAIDMLHAAKEAGANAIKLQTYSPDTLTLNCEREEFFIKEGPWQGQTMHALYRKAMMPWEWHADLKAEADKIGLTIFSAPFDHSAVDLLSELDFPALKIASPELIDLELIEYAAQSGKPLIISNGLATLAEIQEAVNTVQATGNDQLCLLKCTSEYPAPYSAMNLRTIPHLAQTFGCPAGLSDHSQGIGVPVAAVSLGAVLIEKHFILDKNQKTVDSFFSLTAKEFAQMVQAVREAEQALGGVHYEQKTYNKRRSLYAANDIAAGETFTRDNVRNVRPGVGLAPKYLKAIEGKSAARAIQMGEPLFWEMVTP